jgi:hypothetical protein
MISSYDSSNEEWHLQGEEQGIAILLAMHANKRPTHGGSVFGQQEFVAGKNRMPQQVDAELFCGESNIFEELFSSLFSDEHRIVQAYHGRTEEV